MLALYMLKVLFFEWSLVCLALATSDLFHTHIHTHTNTDTHTDSFSHTHRHTHTNTHTHTHTTCYTEDKYLT